MRHLVSHLPRHLIVLFLASVLASCGGDGSSPIAPSSSTGGGGQSGATIQGRVNGLAAAAALSVAPAAEVSGDADEGLTIEVLGTGQSVEVGSDGEFVITGLGALADVVLRVSGPDVAGGSQDVPLGTELAADGMLEVELRVDSGTVVVESVEVENSPDDDSSDDSSSDDLSDDDSSDDISDDDSSDDISDDDSSDDISDDSSSDDTSDDDSSDDTSDDDSSDDISDDDSSDDDV